MTLEFDQALARIASRTVAIAADLIEDADAASEMAIGVFSTILAAAPAEQRRLIGYQMVDRAIARIDPRKDSE